MEPIDIVESNEETIEPPTDDTETEADVPGLSVSLHDEEADTSLDSDVSCAQESEPTRASGRLEIPGAKSRKRKAKARGRDDDFAKYMAESNKAPKRTLNCHARLTQFEVEVDVVSCNPCSLWIRFHEPWEERICGVPQQNQRHIYAFKCFRPVRE
uniref:Uncharacterized protein n=1 Tax=Knipowitschia caucasica TaxID=637954 RepID=A0AAV2KNY7_KNICA